MNKKKIFLIILTILILIVVIFLIYTTFFQIKIDNSLIIYQDDLQIEVYDKVSVSNLVENIEGELLEDKQINTNELGEQNIQFLYKDKNGRKKYGTVTINIIDSTEPIIFVNETYQINKDSDKSLTDILMSVDNYDSNPKREIIGTYDISTEGNYPLVYQVTDSSNNISKKEFILKVIDPNKIEKKEQEETYTDFTDILKEHKKDNTKIGIDVSKWQEEVDYTKVKESGAEFVMIRVGSQDGIEGESILDPYFEENIKKVQENDLKVGVYYYSHAKDIKEAKEQAKWIIDKLSPYEIDLPVVFDWENWSNFNTYSVSLYDINLIADTFLREIEKEGYKSMLYGSKFYLENIWNVENEIIWLAHYTNKTTYDKDYMMWQLCSDGKIEGINTYVDIDVLYE